MTKKLSFQYHLRIDFDSPVQNHSFALRFCPQTDERQQILSHKIQIYPQEDLWESEDGFGNHYIAGSVRAPHQCFEADVTGMTELGKQLYVLEKDKYRENIFQYQTALTAPDLRIRKAADEISGKDPLETAGLIMEYLHRKMVYTAGATNVTTTAAQAFALGRGVCQDYSHIMLSMLRYKGICARYVVGMLMGEGLSHAWVEVRRGEKWYGYDPTNNLCVENLHIKMSHGRDFQDCRINIGCFSGSAKQRQQIQVKVWE